MHRLDYFYTSFSMKRLTNILVFITLPFLLKAQVVFKTVVPQLPVVAGESFQVQYIIEDAGKVSNFYPPDFKAFRMVAGPNTYTGSMMTYNRIKQVTNTVYTLSAIYPGRFIISGAVANINGNTLRSNDVVVEVISKKEAAKRFGKDVVPGNSEYFLRPGEDVQEKIRKNLFMKVMVDKQHCFVGEPVVAVFKLYSRLESKSDIVKNPGFYGFTVYDMVSLADNQSSTEVVNGKQFDVHTIRKVQLYPLQEGHYSIDPMEVKNRVEFSHSIINKKTEQEIVEGVLGNNSSDEANEGVEIFETDISTEPVAINVKPSPIKNAPASFNGATGNFFISSSLLEDKVARNEEGHLVITISGSGNFTQLAAPILQWPQSIEGFDPVVTDSLNKMHSPLTGSRTFRYAFVSNKPGHYEMPAVAISFFDPKQGIYKTVATKALQLTITNEEKISKPVLREKEKKIYKGNTTYWLVAGAGLLVCLAGLFWFIQKRKKKQVVKENEKPRTRILSIKEILATASILSETEDKIFYSTLHQCIWNYFRLNFDLSGSDMNKELLKRKLEEKHISDRHITDVLDILQQCETGMFTNVRLEIDKASMLENTTTTLEQINV